MVYTDKVIQQSNHCYNDGLRRAQIRDLTGAIISLKRSLQYCRQNIAARNLLGLVYYGRGEINEALVEWIISKNLKAHDNAANYFIKKVQNTPEDLEKINLNIKKYNQCLQSCHQDAEDIALIQLKKVVISHPDFIKAHQLLALLCIRKKQYERARQALNKAQKLDTTDPITLYYLNELPEKKSKRQKPIEDENVAYKVGNDTIIQPMASSAFKENASTVTIVNIVIGIGIGAAVVGFLINPALNQSENMRNAQAIRDYSSEISAQKAQINALTTELDTYRNTSDEITTFDGGTTQLSYEYLLDAYTKWSSGSGSSSSISKLLQKMEVRALGEEGTTLYEELYEEVIIARLQSQYSVGESKFKVKDNYNAITALLEVVTLDESYNEYYAMYMLARTYEEVDDIDNAILYYEKIVKNGGDSEHVEIAANRLSGLRSSDSTEDDIAIDG